MPENHDAATCPVCSPILESEAYQRGLAGAPAAEEYETTALTDPRSKLGPKWWPEGTLAGLPLPSDET